MAAVVRKKRTRKGRRGMALLLVMVLITITTAAGVFASNMTAIEIRSAGFTRQAAQTHYVAESGAIVSMLQMSQFCSAYIGLMQAQAATATLPPGLTEPPLRYSFYLRDFLPSWASSPFRTPPMRMYEAGPAEVGGTPGVAGSLGLGSLQPDFGTNVTILGRIDTPLVGYGVSGGRDFSVPMVGVEFDAQGRTRLQSMVGSDATNPTLSVGRTRMLAQLPCL